jgi:DNA-binding PadR family transcriptional regulator
MDNFMKIRTLKILNSVEQNKRSAYFLAGQFNKSVTTVYHLLRELRDTGYINEVHGERGRITYELTTAGKEFLLPIEKNNVKLEKIEQENEEIFDKLGL